MKLSLPPLDEPARYFPLERGVYEVAPGLKKLGTDFGNGPRDSKTFQLDSDFARYRQNKLSCRGERFGKYVQTKDFTEEVSRAVNRAIIDRLVQEHPKIFNLALSHDGSEKLSCAHTGEALVFDPGLKLRGTAYSSTLDALSCQIQEDIAVMTREGDKNWLAALHLCSPSHWSAEDKIGKSFFDIHTPVPGIQKINSAHLAWVDAMITKGPYVRFVWGFGTDDRLNHHPEAPPGQDPVAWKGRSFSLRQDGKSPFILRVERQVLLPLPKVQSAIFLIRVSFVDGQAIKSNPKERELLRSALQSMTEESLVYKGLKSSLPDILAWL